MHIAVSDFGLAEVVNRRKACNDKYKLDSRMAIPYRWYAPESLEKNIYNHKSDVWSFGITTWEILSLCQYSEPYKNDKDYQEFSRKYQKVNVLDCFISDRNNQFRNFEIVDIIIFSIL